MILAGLIMLVASGCGSRREAARKSVDLAQNEEFERRKSGETQVNSPTEITPELGCGGRRVTVARFEKGEVIPIRPVPGREVNYRIAYSACPGYAERLSGTLTRRLTYGRQVIMEEKENVTLKPGRWTVDIFIGIPPQTAPGWYRFETVFENPTLQLRDRQDFNVVGKPSQ